MDSARKSIDNRALCDRIAWMAKRCWRHRWSRISGKRPTTTSIRNNYLSRLGPWRDAAKNRDVKSVTAKEVSGKIEVTVQAILPVGKSRYDVVYTLQSPTAVSPSTAAIDRRAPICR